MDFGFKKMVDFAMNVDKLKLANWVGEVMDEIVKFASHNKTFWLGERECCTGA